MWLHIAVGVLWGLGIGAWLWRRPAILSDAELCDMEEHLAKHYEL